MDIFKIWTIFIYEYFQIWTFFKFEYIFLKNENLKLEQFLNIYIFKNIKNKGKRKSRINQKIRTKIKRKKPTEKPGN